MPRVQCAHLLPHASLVRAMPRAGGEIDVDALLHREPHLPVGHDLALAELPRGVGPASLLGAAHRHHDAAVAADQDARVEHAVLLRAAQLLAVEHQDAPVALVDHAQFGHGPSLAHLGDRGAPVGQSLPQRDVARPVRTRQAGAGRRTAARGPAAPRAAAPRPAPPRSLPRSIPSCRTSVSAAPRPGPGGERLLLSVSPPMTSRSSLRMHLFHSTDVIITSPRRPSHVCIGAGVGVQWTYL